LNNKLYVFVNNCSSLSEESPIEDAEDEKPWSSKVWC